MAMTTTAGIQHSSYCLLNHKRFFPWKEKNRAFLKELFSFFCQSFLFIVAPFSTTSHKPESAFGWFVEFESSARIC